MADNYVKSCTVVNGLNVDDKRWVHEHAARLEDEDDGIWGIGFEFDVKSSGGDGELFDLHVFGSSIDDESAINFMRQFLHARKPDEHVIMSFAFTCSAMRADEFGGYVVLVTATDEHWFNPWVMAHQFLAGDECRPLREDHSTTVDVMAKSIGS